MSKTSETPQTNPLREGLATRAVPQPCDVVIFRAIEDHLLFRADLDEALGQKDKARHLHPF
jgi:hypothetical protein